VIARDSRGRLFRTLVVPFAMLFGATVHAAATKSPPHASCTFTETPTTLEGALALTPKSRLGGVVLNLVISGTAQKQMHGTLRRGRQTLLNTDTMLDASTGASASTVTFGAGFRHIREMSLRSTDGKTFTGDVDGHQLEPFRIPADPNTLRFVGGASLSKRIKVKHFVAVAVRKLAHVGVTACTSSTGPPLTSPAPQILGLDCDACNLACGAAYWICLASAQASIEIPLAYAAAVGLCQKAVFECSDACETGDACCPVPCTGGTPNASGPTTYCKATCSHDTVCCGGPSNPQGTCCDSSADCCATYCLEGAFAGDVCKDPQRGVFCFAGAGDVCNGALDQSACCPADAAVCRVPASGDQPQLCCATGSGEVCGSGASKYCCPSSTPHCDERGECCAVSDVCGNGGECCPSHNCLGDACCRGQICSGILGNQTCCGEGTFCNVRSGVCCPALGGVTCGLGCCDTTTGECINESCCPKAQACGTVCCPGGNVCTDPNTGTCSSCPSGLNVCTPQSPGPATCCAAGIACCGRAGPDTATVCCQPGQICCQEVPFDQCTDPGDCRPIP